VSQEKGNIFWNVHSVGGDDDRKLELNFLNDDDPVIYILVSFMTVVSFIIANRRSSVWCVRP
jgi:hypothetical protein